MNLIKRIVPFVLAIALGMFIASFFVTVGFPKFREGQRFSHRHKRGEEMRRIQVERDALQREREALEREKELMRLNVEGELRNARIQNYGSDETVPRGQGYETGNGRSRR
jgi:hypothetical protein